MLGVASTARVSACSRAGLALQPTPRIGQRGSRSGAGAADLQPRRVVAARGEGLGEPRERVLGIGRTAASESLLLPV